MSGPYILSLDQGTTSSRAIIFDASLKVIAIGQQEFPQHFPASGWVEHEPQDLWATIVAATTEALKTAGLAATDIATIGITNQRETTLVWDKNTGAPIYNAIVWQDRRTADYCHKMKADGHEALIADTTGLLLDPYFSATKLHWLLENVDGARERAEKGELIFGTVDTYLIWRMTGGAAHVTDATNAARTALYDIHQGQWSDAICGLFDIPQAMLPTVCDSAADFGTCGADVFGAAIPIQGVAGDQQAATVGQACFERGMVKSTYGTGCFALINTGDAPVASKNRLLTTIAYQLDGKPTYALEGSIFIAGAVVQWLRDGLQIIKAAPETQTLAEAADPTENVIMVPAFTGLGAPYWDPDCRGAIFGLTRNSGPAEFARAALESVGFQTRDLIDAMQADMGAGGEAILRVDGGMSASDWTMQFLSDILGAPVDRPEVLETTALGAAWLAGMKAGICPSPEEFGKTWSLERRFEPAMDAETRAEKCAGWKDAVRRTLGG